jgi:hypothetical protein
MFISQLPDIRRFQSLRRKGGLRDLRASQARGPLRRDRPLADEGLVIVKQL